jgi:hypothetical protein
LIPEAPALIAEHILPVFEYRDHDFEPGMVLWLLMSSTPDMPGNPISVSITSGSALLNNFNTSSAER